MHIEPGVVQGAKLLLGYVTGAGAATFAAHHALETVRENGAASVAARSLIGTGAVLAMFQLLPHPPVGVSEVHLILGSTLFLVLGAGPAAIALAMGLLLQGILFSPFDLPQYGMNITTLLVPLFGLSMLARRVIAPNTAYVDLSYAQVARLSLAYQGGIIAWVAFWALYGEGVSAASLASVASFGAAYLTVVLIEPLVDLAVLAGAKSLKGLGKTGLVTSRLHAAA